MTGKEECNGLHSKKNSYPPEVRTQALELYKEHGPAVASERTGVPKGTIASWAHRDGVEPDTYLRHTEVAAAVSRNRNELRRAEIATQAAEVATVAFDRAAEALEDGDPRAAKEYTLTAAIATDKHLLLSGEATSRIESGGTPEARQLRVVELMAMFEARREQQSRDAVEGRS